MWHEVVSPRGGRTGKVGTRVRRLVALAGALAVLGGCQGDMLDPGGEITGPIVTLAPQTVSVGVEERRAVELGGDLRVTVAANTGTGSSGVVRIGATALVLNRQRMVIATVPVEEVAFPQPQQGTVVRQFGLRPSPAHVDLNNLPDTLQYELHGWAVSGGGACVASVTEAPQRLPCGQSEGLVVAQGFRGEAFSVEILPPHSVGLQTMIPPRIEPGDVMAFTVTARTRLELGDIRQVGVAARVRAGNGTPVSVVLASRDVVGQAEVIERFSVTFQQLVEALPPGFVVPPNRTLTLEPSAYALHQTGACVAAAQNGQQQLPCAVVNGGRIAAGGAPVQPATVIGVEGRTVPLPTGLTEVGDLVVHTPSQRLFLSNRGGHTLEVLDLNNLAAGFSPNPVRVGSRPWGMALSTDGTQVLVANSGGTDISAVSLGTLAEVQRIPIPRLRLYQLDGLGSGTIQPSHHTYVDRPQHLAQDERGFILYSAGASQAAPVGTLRVLERHAASGVWSSRFLFPGGSLGSSPPMENRGVTASPGSMAIAHLDSITFVYGEVNGVRGWTGEVVLFDHRPDRPIGHPERVIQSDTLPFEEARVQIRQRDSDVVIYPGYSWNIPESLAFGDTSFVAASGDRRWVGFAEGVTLPGGRVTLWGAGPPTLSRVDDVRDLLNNTSDRVTAIDLNHTGTLGVVRGQRGVYFFDRFLRLQGTGGTALETGGGVGFLPGDRPLAQQLVFLGTGRSSIQVLEPVHYRVIGEVSIRDVVNGPLRVAPCAPGAPGDCVATVYAVTASGVMALDVREAHLQR
jgi:DNA-binding beta-propeller fold protein YncE